MDLALWRAFGWTGGVGGLWGTWGDSGTLEDRRSYGYSRDVGALEDWRDWGSRENSRDFGGLVEDWREWGTLEDWRELEDSALWRLESLYSPGWKETKKHFTIWATMFINQG